jgi:hypothetical protein
LEDHRSWLAIAATFAIIVSGSSYRTVEDPNRRHL